VWVRRLVTTAPSLAVIAIGLDPTRTLVISQVVLSFGLPFALIPLLMFTSNKSLMGPMTNRRVTTALMAINHVHGRAAQSFSHFPDCKGMTHVQTYFRPA